MCASSNVYIVFPFKVCDANTIDKGITTQWDIGQFRIYVKCSKLNHIYFKYTKGSNDPWLWISFCNDIFTCEHWEIKISNLWQILPLLLKTVILISVEKVLSNIESFSNALLLFSQFNNF